MQKQVNGFIFIAMLLGLLVSNSVYAYTPKAEKVVDNVYAIIGPLVQRSKENDGLNNNLGFIVTKTGVILIDSGASQLGAKKIEQAVKAITSNKIKWVINTGSQDHRWLGNDYFSSKGAEIIALEKTVNTQKKFAERHIASLTKFLGSRLKGTNPLTANRVIKGNKVTLNLGGEKLLMEYTNAHFPGDAWVWLPEHSVIFTGDLVYIDRLLSVRNSSSIYDGQKAYQRMEALKPKYIVPGHGRVSDSKRARVDSGDYYDFLVGTVGAAAMEMEDIDGVMDRYEYVPDFAHLKFFEGMHRTNMSRTFIEFENR